MTSQNIKILVLAAGKSKRMGKPKQLLPVADLTLIELALRSAEKARVSGVYCVLGANAEAIKPVIANHDISIIENAQWEEGIGKSISEGAKAILEREPKTTGILILLADQPNIDANYLEKIITNFEERPDTVIASDYGGFYGVPSLFSKPYFDILTGFTTDSGAKDFLNDPSIPVIGVKSVEKLNDIDTPADYEAFLKSQNI
ncbi:NTP transferase domain-containing protein [Flavimarina sp. Hel_I_48]|uniref:nucleotidyltransferase family protein n=1 Tax=Flavimarina sp. Hel_I_48 TaxID=1392488 RepID=UPI0006909F86|nr:nucleotidyltransferase family protein [Flavimarina sp. Hel_I_48]